MKLRALTALSAAVVLVASACGDDDTADDTSAPTEAAAASTAPASSAPAVTTGSTEGDAVPAEIVAEGFEFQGDVTVAPGATITLTNNDSEPHTVTADDDSFDSGPFQPGEPGELVAPTEPGEYPFHCEIHPSMQATLIVSEDATSGSAPAGSAPASDTTAPGSSFTGSLEAEDQDGDGTTLSVASVSIEGGDGFIAVHQDLDGAPGPVVGHVAVPEGDSSDVVVELDAAVESGDYWPMLHLDAGELGTYEFPGPDAPVMSGSDVVMQQITLTVG